MDVLFDLMNSRLCIADKPARCALSNRNDNFNRLQEMKKWIGTWQFIGARAQSAIKCHWGLQTSITSILSLTSELFSEGFSYVCTSRFNQDCVENFFAGIRSKNGWNENPSPAQFATAFRNAIVLSTLDVSSVGKNCLSDEDFALISHVDLVSEFTKSIDDAVKLCSDEGSVEDCVASKPNVSVRPTRTPETDEVTSVNE